MKETFVKKYWGEENTLFYIHFHDEMAIRQIEVTSKGKTFLSLANPNENESMLYDQSIDGLDLNENDFITKDEFDTIWNQQYR